MLAGTGPRAARLRGGRKPMLLAVKSADAAGRHRNLTSWVSPVFPSRTMTSLLAFICD